jgi:surface carbohydrate biosynthesis protein
MTGNDNNQALASLAREQSQIKVIFVQTALRDTKLGFPSAIELPSYFAFGNRERHIFNFKHVRAKEYLAIGSIKLGYALCLAKDFQVESADLCFVSLHRPERTNRAVSCLEQSIEATNDSLFKLSCQYAQKNSLSLRVVGKAREPQSQKREQLHYEQLSDDLVIDFVTADKQDHELNTYFGFLASNVVIHSASTLGFEALAAGKKVLFGASMTPNLIEDWGVAVYFDGIPDKFQIKENHFCHFESKLNVLRDMSAADYRHETDRLAHDLISNDPIRPPHEQIREIVSCYLQP